MKGPIWEKIQRGIERGSPLLILVGIISNPTPTAALITLIERRRLRDTDQQVRARAWVKVGLVWAAMIVRNLIVLAALYVTGKELNIF